jgi:hypothetical protein
MDQDEPPFGEHTASVPRLELQDVGSRLLHDRPESPVPRDEAAAFPPPFLPRAVEVALLRRAVDPQLQRGFLSPDRGDPRNDLRMPNVVFGRMIRDLLASNASPNTKVPSRIDGIGGVGDGVEGDGERVGRDVVVAEAGGGLTPGREQGGDGRSRSNGGGCGSRRRRRRRRRGHAREQPHRGHDGQERSHGMRVAARPRGE